MSTQQSLFSPWPERMVRRLPANPDGRDFVVGDIHGAYDLVLEGMSRVGFDRKRDRLISVGDLIDRGRGSARVVKFLGQPYVHAVRGNHDHDFCTLTPQEIRAIAVFPRFGMGWAANVSDEGLLEIQQALRQLPVAMEIPTRRGLVGIVHAEPLPGVNWQSFLALLERRDEAAVDCALRSRERLRSESQEGVPGVGRVYVGHTVQRGGARMYGNVVAVDTGAVLRELGADPERHHLSMVRLEAATADLSALVSQAVPPAERGVRAIEQAPDHEFTPAAQIA